jgi:clan AA aspartic protease (TIGR02281 family)
MRFYLDSADSVAAIPVELVGMDSRLLIRMAVDTGATLVMIPWKVAEFLGYDPAISKEKVQVTTASTVEKIPLITIKDIIVLGKSLRNVKVAVHDLPPESAVDGLLGLSFLSKFNLKMMFKEGYLELD